MNATMFSRVLLSVFLALGFPAASFAYWDVGIGVRVGYAPPELPIYSQPPCPAPGYIWTPGYWGYSDDDQDYYWVPGTWVLAPSSGLLWTPGYWAVLDNDFEWHEGYWAPHVGFYGGINYGFGYFGVGFAGGEWRGDGFYYNRAVTNITNVNITNVYNSTVINNNVYATRASFNGEEGVRSRPTPAELIAAREPHRSFTSLQRLQAETARKVPELLASINHGHPNIAATVHPGMFNGRNAGPAQAAGGAPTWPRVVPSTPLYTANYVGHPGVPRPDVTNRPSLKDQGLPAQGWTQHTMTRGNEPVQNSGGGNNEQHSVPQHYSAPHYSAPARFSTPAHYDAPLRPPSMSAGGPRFESHAPGMSAPRSAPYRPATAYRQAPSYSASRASQPTPRAQSYALRSQPAIAQMPRNETNAHSSPPQQHAGGRAPMASRRRS